MHCHLCGLPIKQGEAWHVEHIVALACGGADDDANMAPAHIDCHAPKTKDDVRAAAKIKRIAARHVGATPPPKQRIANRGFAKREREERIPVPARRPMWITLDNPRGDD
jgi:5-methylcytosine-specific restriction endonuclease McrA